MTLDRDWRIEYITRRRRGCSSSRSGSFREGRSSRRSPAWRARSFTRCTGAPSSNDSRPPPRRTSPRSTPGSRPARGRPRGTARATPGEPGRCPRLCREPRPRPAVRAEALRVGVAGAEPRARGARPAPARFRRTSCSGTVRQGRGMHRHVRRYRDYARGALRPDPGVGAIPRLRRGRLRAARTERARRRVSQLGRRGPRGRDGLPGAGGRGREARGPRPGRPGRALRHRGGKGLRAGRRPALGRGGRSRVGHLRPVRAERRLPRPAHPATHRAAGEDLPRAPSRARSRVRRHGSRARARAGLPGRARLVRPQHHADPAGEGIVLLSRRDPDGRRARVRCAVQPGPLRYLYQLPPGVPHRRAPGARRDGRAAHGRAALHLLPHHRAEGADPHASCGRGSATGSTGATSARRCARTTRRSSCRSRASRRSGRGRGCTARS
jgi:hypothetical protein